MINLFYALLYFIYEAFQGKVLPIEPDESPVTYGPVTKQFLVQNKRRDIYVHYEKRQRHLQLLVRRHRSSEACKITTRLPPWEALLITT